MYMQFWRPTSKQYNIKYVYQNRPDNNMFILLRLLCFRSATGVTTANKSTIVHWAPSATVCPRILKKTCLSWYHTVQETKYYTDLDILMWYAKPSSVSRMQSICKWSIPANFATDWSDSNATEEIAETGNTIQVCRWSQGVWDRRWRSITHIELR